MNPESGKTLRLILSLAAVCALAVFTLLLLYNYDNKYTAKQPHASKGVLNLSVGAAAHQVLFLISGWEYYGGALFKPEDFSSGNLYPDQYIYVGQ